MEKRWKLILDTPYNPFYNMAKDEALLDWYDYTRIPIFRLYQWSGESISLGYFQKFKDVVYIDLLNSFNIPCVRRPTGGGAILHGRDISYSIVCSRQDLGIQIPLKESYYKITSFLITFYKKLGCNAVFSNTLSNYSKDKFANFCFSQIESYDILVNSRKIGGNAQRWRKNLLLQQGSIPQDINWELIKLVFKGIKDIEGRIITLKEITLYWKDVKYLMDLLINSFQETFNVQFIEGKDDKENIEKLVKKHISKYERSVVY